MVNTQKPARRRAFALGVQPKGNQAGQRGHGRAQPADVDAQQQLAHINCKARDHHGRRHIADHLAAQDANYENAAFKEKRKGVLDRIDTFKVANDDKKANKGQKQTVVHFCEQAPVYDQGDGQDEDQGNSVVEDADDHRDTEQKQTYIIDEQLF